MSYVKSATTLKGTVNHRPARAHNPEVGGLVLASRVLPFDGFVMTTGAALTAAKSVLDEVFDYLDDEGRSPEEMQNLSRDKWADLAAMAIGLCLDSQDDVRIKYRDVPQDE